MRAYVHTEACSEYLSLLERQALYTQTEYVNPYASYYSPNDDSPVSAEERVTTPVASASAKKPQPKEGTIKQRGVSSQSGSSASAGAKRRKPKAE